MTQLVKALAISGLALTLGACGGEDDKGSGPAPGRDTSTIDIQAASKVMEWDSCESKTSRFSSNHFIIGTADGVGDETLKSTLRAAQASFEAQLAKTGFDAYSDLGIDSASKIEVCVDTSEGSNGMATGYGVIIGTGRTGSNLDLLLDHELTHTISDRLAGLLGFNSIHRWFNEGMATLFSDNATVGKSEMQAFYTTGFKPVEVKHSGAGDVVREVLGPKAWIEYPAYNTVLKFLKSQGASNSDLWEVYKEAWKIEQSCRTQMAAAYEATKHLDMTEQVGRPSYGYNEPACNSTFFFSEEQKALYKTTYNGRDVDSDTLFEVAFDEIIGTRTGITYQTLVQDFDALVTNGYLN